jgi:hypothetical protein
MTIVITVISITVGALYIKAMLDFKKEAAEYLDNRKNDITKEPKPEETLDTKSSISNHNIDNEIRGENTNKPTEDSKSPEALKNQQKLVVNTLYKDLFIDLGLNEEEIDQFEDIIIESQMSDTEHKESNTNNKDEMIKELLGDLYYDVYEEYERTIIQRKKIMQYKQQLSLSNIILVEEQESNLLSIMLKQVSDKKILERAKLFLDNEQIEVLEKYLNTNRNSEEIDIKMLAESYNNNNRPGN